VFKAFIRVFTVLFVLVFCFALGYLSSSLNLFGNLFSRLFGPPTVSIVSVLEQIEGMSQLTTTRFTFSNELTYERDMPAVFRALYGETVIFDVVGHVDAGLDLSTLTAANFIQDGDTLTIQLPPASLQDCFLNESQSRIRSRTAGLLSSQMTSMDLNARRQIVQIIRDSALENGILEEAQIRTEVVLGELINSIVPDEMTVRIVPAPAGTETPLPVSCS
jgi:hypothetical protein